MAHSKQHRDAISRGLKRYHSGKGKTTRARVHKPKDVKFKLAGKSLKRDLAGLQGHKKPRKPRVPNIKRDLNKLVRTTKRANAKRR